MTVDKAFADRIVAGNGWSVPPEHPDSPPPDDMPVVRIVIYQNTWGGQGYGCTFAHEDQEKYLRLSPYIKNPRVYWERSAPCL